MSDTVALVVDNSLSMRKYIRTILQDELRFQETHEAANGEDALRLLDANPAVKWIFSALEMPGMSAQDFLDNLRANHGNRDAHVVLVTAREELSAREIAIRENVSDYLCKPFSPDQLIQKVRRLAGLRERRAAERFTPALPCEVDLGFDPFHVYSAELVDISLGGCRVKTSPIHPDTGHVNDLATISLQPEKDPPLRLDGQIRRVETGDCALDAFGCVQIAFEFIHENAEQRKALEGYIASCKTGKPLGLQ
jgi:two-component system chemotaxis response regulator CheY